MPPKIDSRGLYFGWNKARMTCFVNMLLALLAMRTVNLNKLAYVVFGDALQSSRYLRIQRFFSKFSLDYQQFVMYKKKKKLRKNELHFNAENHLKQMT